MWKLWWIIESQYSNSSTYFHRDTNSQSYNEFLPNPYFFHDPLFSPLPKQPNYKYQLPLNNSHSIDIDPPTLIYILKYNDQPHQYHIVFYLLLDSIIFLFLSRIFWWHLSDWLRIPQNHHHYLTLLHYFEVVWYFIEVLQFFDYWHRN